jgi:methyl coenzyme M reductase subunit D
MDLINAKYNSTRNCVVVHGKEYTVKVQRGRYYIHADNRQITVTDVVKAPVDNYDPVFDYVFKGGSVTHPCPAMDYWIYRHRMGHKITITDYKNKFGIKKKIM